MRARNETSQEQRSLRAGDVTVTLDGADLRWLQQDDREFVRRVFFAIRDPLWAHGARRVSGNYLADLDVSEVADLYLQGMLWVAWDARADAGAAA